MTTGQVVAVEVGGGLNWICLMDLIKYFQNVCAPFFVVWLLAMVAGIITVTFWVFG
jgi:hypothetical protein